MYWNISKFNNCVVLLTTPGSFFSLLYKVVVLLGPAVRYVEI